MSETHLDISESSYFIREHDLNDGKVLQVYQQSVGDVGCVVWDAAIVLAKYIECKEFGCKLMNKRVIELGAGTGFVGLVASCLGADVLITDLPEFVPLMKKNIAKNEDVVNGYSTETCDISKQHSKLDNAVVNGNAINLQQCMKTNDAHNSIHDVTYNAVDETRMEDCGGVYGTEQCDEKNTIIKKPTEKTDINNEDNIQNIAVQHHSICAKSLVWGDPIPDDFPSYDYILLSDCIYYSESTSPLVNTLKCLCHRDATILMSYETRLTGDKPQLQARFFHLMDEHFERHEIHKDQHDSVYQSDDIHIIKFCRKS